MQRLITIKALTIAKRCDHLLLSQRHLIIPSQINFNKSVDDYVEKQLEKEPSKLPLKLQSAYAAIRKRFKREPDYIDPELRTLLDKAAGQLYFDCANKYPYLVLCKSFGLEDYMSTWFKLTLIHVWMLLVRIHVTLDAAAYNRIRDGILNTLWMDVDKRLEILGDHLNQKLNTTADMRKMNGLYVQTLLEYDEGFLQDDPFLAAAVWRNLYLQRSFDPIHVNTVVRYIRASVAYLETIEVNDLLVNGIKSWKPAESLKEGYTPI